MEIKDYQIAPFTKFDKDRGLLTAGTENDFKSMTINRDGMGILLNKPVVFLFVNSARYTYEFVSRRAEITVSFCDKEFKKALGIFGFKSGRDMDKAKAV